MLEGGLTLLCLVSGYVAFVFLALCQKMHFVAVTGARRGTRPEATQRMRFRQRASLCMVASVASAYFGSGPSFGSLLSVLCLATSAAAVSLTLAWSPEWLRVFVSARENSTSKAAGRTCI
jgi:NAD(P)-dependent dehydrogenase (short-subunit alcohol dehydrogenase family)